MAYLGEFDLPVCDSRMTLDEAAARTQFSPLDRANLDDSGGEPRYLCDWPPDCRVCGRCDDHCECRETFVGEGEGNE